MTNARASRLHRDTADQNAAVPPIHDGMEGELVVNEAQSIPRRRGDDGMIGRPVGHFYLAEYRQAREDVAHSPRLSFYSRDGFWLSKRRDGRSPSWQIARPLNGSVVYKSTGTSDFAEACKALDAYAESAGAAEPRLIVRASTTVYFIQSETGLIKIGASHDYTLRLKSLQAMSPVKLTVLATTPGRIGDERDYHRRFREHRSHGEWFNPHPDILAEIDRLAGAA